MMSQRRRIAAGAALAGITLLSAACGGGDSGGSGGGSSKPTEGVKADSVDYGLIYDQTGPTAATQVPFGSGLKAAIKAGGDVNGRKVNIVECDEKYQVAPAVACLRQMINQTPVVGFTGLNNSSFQAAGVPITVQAKLPSIGAESTSKSLISPYNGYTYALECTYPNQADVAVAFAMKKLGRKDIKTLTLAGNVASGTGYADLVKARVEKAGGTYLKTVTFEYGSPNVDQQAQEIASLKPDVIFTHGGTAQNVIAFKSFEKFGVTSTPVIGIFAQMTQPIVTASTAVGKNYYAVNCYTSATQSEVPGVAKMVTDAKAAGYAADVYNSTDFTNGYVVGLVVLEALKRAGKDLSRQGLADAVAKLTNFDTNGLSPTITFGENNALGVQAVRPYAWDYAASAWKAQGEYADYAKCYSAEYTSGNIDKWSPDCISGG